MNIAAKDGTQAEYIAALIHQQKAALAEAPVDLELDRARNRIAIIGETMQRVREVLGVSADGVFGGEVTAADPQTAQPARIGRLGKLHDALDDLDRLACAVATQAERFSRL